jgi:hypothetical protein
MVLAVSDIKWELIPYKFIDLDLLFELCDLGLPEVQFLDLTREQWELILASSA